MMRQAVIIKRVCWVATLLLTLLLLIPIGAFAVDEEGLRPPSYMMVALPDTQLLNVRKQAKKDASAWGTQRGGTQLYVTELDGAWATVDFDGEMGYVLVAYLEITADVDCTVVSDGRVRIREKPGGKVVGFLHDSDIAHIKAWRYNSEGALWARLSSGYVLASYLELKETYEEDNHYGE